MTYFIHLLKKLQVSSIWLKKGLSLAVVCCLAFFGTAVRAQTIYGVGSSTGAAPFTATYTVNPATGATNLNCQLPYTSAAIGVSSLDGLIYFIEQNVANPRIQSINPVTCALGVAVATTLPNPTLRATSCPDGRFYAMGNTAQFFEINPNTGVTIRTLNLTGPATGGSGDFGCTSTGDLYLIGNATTNATTYDLFTAPSASFQGVATGSTVAMTNVGSLVLPNGTNSAPNGISEAPPGLPGCAAAPAPCLVVSTGVLQQLWQINSLTGAATVAGPTTGGSGTITLTDLSRSFPVDLGSTKAVTPTSSIQGTQTVVYTLTVSNLGPGVVRSVTVTDTLSPAFTAVSWSCSVNTAGTPSLITTGCGVSPSGTGNINNTVSLSIGGSLIYKITATLSSTFSGTLTNAAGATMVNTVFDPNTANNNATVTTTISPAASLGVTKTDGITTTVAGSTTNYTVTFTNSGPGSADGSTIKDVPSAGLSSCTVVSCTPTGAAVCPVTLANLLSVAGTPIPTFPAGSSLIIRVRCGVTATGL